MPLNDISKIKCSACNNNAIYVYRDGNTFCRLCIIRILFNNAFKEYEIAKIDKLPKEEQERILNDGRNR